MNMPDVDMKERTMLKAADIKELIGALSATMSAHAAELTALDSAIGDGDHGINMKRGFEALEAEADAISEKPPGEALKAAGMKLVMTVGGASGPLFGTLLMTLGKEIGDAPDLAGFSGALRKAVDAVAQRGKSGPGQKTMLDVLYPVVEAAEAGTDGASMVAIARQAAEATVPMIATRGRASFLGERSAGHMDPGARSSVLIAETVSAWMESRK